MIMGISSKMILVGGVGPSGMGKYDGKGGLNFQIVKLFIASGIKFDRLFEIIDPYKGNLESVLKNLLNNMGISAKLGLNILV